MIKSYRISGTSVRPWELHGPIDQALKTTIQADSVRVIGLRVPLHGIDTEMELWVDGAQESRHGPNVVATGIAVIALARSQGISIDRELVDDPDGEQVWATTFNAPFEDIDLIHGPAVLTGAGGTDAPEVHLGRLMAALMGED